jgi:hypothetical protein
VFDSISKYALERRMPTHARWLWAMRVSMTAVCAERLVRRKLLLPQDSCGFESPLRPRDESKRLPILPILLGDTQAGHSPRLPPTVPGNPMEWCRSPSRSIRGRNPRSHRRHKALAIEGVRSSSSIPIAWIERICSSAGRRRPWRGRHDADDNRGTSRILHESSIPRTGATSPMVLSIRTR